MALPTWETYLIFKGVATNQSEPRARFKKQLKYKYADLVTLSNIEHASKKN